MQRKPRAAVGVTLGLLVSGLVAGLPAQAADGEASGRTAVLSVRSSLGQILPDAEVSYRPIVGDMAKAIPQGDGTCLISGASEKCTLFIEHPAYGDFVVEVRLSAAKSTVDIQLGAGSAQAKVFGSTTQIASRSALLFSEASRSAATANRGGSGGGEDCAGAPLIPGLPFSDAGDTSSAADDYNEVCPFATLGGLDVVYAFAPAADVTVDITLCANSAYDTKLYVYENTCPGPVIGCNDDTCSTPSFTSAFVSELLGVNMVAGNTYYIVVDGFNGSGAYTIDITEVAPPPPPPPPGSCDSGVGCQLPDQQGHGDAGVLAATSDLAVGFIAADDFVVSNDSVITSVCWWGVYLIFDFFGVTDCSPGPGDSFTITYYNDDAGGLVPGTVKAGPFQVTASKGPTGATILGNIAEYVFEATHPAVNIAQGECCWIEITNSGDGTCVWLWSAAPAGDDRSAQDDGGGYANTDYDLAFCVNEAIDDGACGAPPGPPNDTCGGAESVDCNGSVTFDNSTATTSPDEPAYSCHFGGAAQGVGNVWYSFVATEDSAFLETNNGPASDTLLAVYDGGCGGLVEIGCSEDEGDGLLSEVCVEGLTPGATYLVQVGSFSAFSQGSITLDITCPCPAAATNDFCADAIAVAVPSVTPGSTSEATTDTGLPFCNVSATSPGVWYTVVGTGNTMTASICNGVANFDSKLTVYCGDCDEPLCIAGNDDSCGFQSEVTWCSQNGATYLILVHGFGGASGPFELEISDNGASCSGAVACLPEGACCGGDFSDPSGGCTHEVEMFDSFGDGWNGATMDVLVNGNVVLSGIAAAGSGSLVSFSAATGDAITTVYSTGSFESENSYEIRDGLGNVIGSDGPSPSPGIAATGNCPEAGAQPVCDVTTEASCAAAGGSYQGDDTDCGGQSVFVVDLGTNAFEDISATGAIAPNASDEDDDGDEVPIGFTFNFFGDDHSTIVTTSNGYLTFGSDDSDFSNDSIPDDNDPNDLIAPYWDDYDPVPDNPDQPDGTCYFETRGTAPNRRFIVQWDNYRQFANDDSNTFQAILFEGSNCIEFRYGEITPESFSGDVTVGVENQDGTDGSSVDAGTVLPGDSISFCPERIPNTCPFVDRMDIKPGSCPNSFNRNSHGVLPVALWSTPFVDVADIDLSSLTISRADGVGGSVGPNQGPPGPHTVFADVATPFDGEGCECHDLGGDGSVDLSMKFRTDDVVAVLELDSESPGALIELVVSGLLNNGDPFEASDCVRLVPPGTAPGLVRVTPGANNSWIEAAPLDLVLDGGGFGIFERVYPIGSVVTLVAPATLANGMIFDAWAVDGARRARGVRTLQLTLVNGIHDVRSLYRRATTVRPSKKQPIGTTDGF